MSTVRDSIAKAKTPQNQPLKGDSNKERKRKVTIKEENVVLDIYSEPLYNADGSRNTKVPFELFVQRKAQEAREKTKKVVTVSKITPKDKEIFQDALKKLKCERQSRSSDHMEYLNNLKKARGVSEEIHRPKKLKSRDGVGDFCSISCPPPKEKKSKSRSRSRSKGKKKEKKGATSEDTSDDDDDEEKDPKLISKNKYRPNIKIPPFKTKPWVPPTCPAEARLGGFVKKNPRPFIVIPPFKTCKWVPKSQTKPRKKINIEYPPLTMRSIPWKPLDKSKKKIKPRVRLEKVFYPMTVSKLGKTWHYFKLLSKFGILRGTTSQYSRKFNFVTNGKQSTFIAATALAFTQLCPTSQWKPQHLDEIIHYGDLNCRQQIRKFRHSTSIHPCDISNKIYLKTAKVLIEICDMVERGIFEPTELTGMRSQIEEMFKKYQTLLIFYCGQCYAIWSEDNGFFAFNSEDTDENAKLTERTRGACCAVRANSLETLVDYLTSNFRITKQRYEIISFHIEKVIKIEDEFAKMFPAKEVVKMKASKPLIEALENVEEVEKIIEIPPERPKSGLAAILFRHQPEPIFGNSFQRSNLISHGFLTCANFLPRSQVIRAPFISTVSVLMLRVCKSSLWMPSTMEKVFEIGHAVFVENVENVFTKIKTRQLELAKAMESDPQPLITNDDDDDSEEEDEFSVANIRKARKARLEKPKIEPKRKHEIPITELANLVIEVGKQKLEVTVENTIIGKVVTRKKNEVSLRVGLENFFKRHDHGLIIGPDVVAVWREQNYFFMFDPNQCHLYHRDDSEIGESSNSCLSWFKNLADLVQLYSDNLKKDQRSLIFKICKIESRNYISKADDWHNFKAISSNKWILSGKISELSEEFPAANRGHQSTCISIIALAKTRQLGVVSWKSETIDQIVRYGDEYYNGCVLQLKDKFVEPNLAINEVGSEFQLENSVIDFTFEESVVIGKLLTDDNSFLSLPSGLQIFFQDEDMGVVMAAGESYAVFKYDNHYFLFDSHMRNDMGKNLNVLDPTSSCNLTGAACLLRFTCYRHLATHILSNLKIGGTTMYSINKVDVSMRSSTAPCLFNYQQFSSEPNAAILRAYDDWHEDCDTFAADLDQKTLCNILSCLCFTRIINPCQWSRLDINEILKTGFKLLCHVANDELKVIWEKLSDVEICSIRLKVQKDAGTKGIFVQSQSLLPHDETATEVIEENVQIAEIEKRESDSDAKKNNDIENEDMLRDSSALEDNSDGQMSVFPELESDVGVDKVPLIDILKLWAQEKEVLAILTSSLFNIAIFKCDRLYFIFDPKASNNLGMLVQKRFDDFIKRYLMKDYQKLLDRLKEEGSKRRMSKEEEFEELIFGRPVKFGTLEVKPSQHILSMNLDEDTVTVSENGSSYVAWFTTHEYLYEHILSKIPEKFRNESFFIHNFTIINNEISSENETSPWNNFTAISENHWILRATFSQNDTQFPVAHRNNQDVPNCLMAMMFQKLCNNEDWNSTVLDVVLKLGERFYKKSLSLQASRGPVSTSELKLKLNQLDLPVFIRPFVINVDNELVLKDLIIKLEDEKPLQKFKEAVGKFLTTSDGGLLISKDYHVSIWRCNDEAYMMFDPHDVGPDGIRKSTGFACLQRFLNHEDLIDTFWHNVKHLEGANEFKLIKISLTMQNYNEEMDEQLEMTNCLAPTSTTILPKTIRARNIVAREESVERTICYAIATLCVSRSLDPEFYTPDIIDRIILLGNELAHECRTNDELCFKDFDISKKSSCPDEINWNFQLNQTFANIQMDIFQRGIISCRPCPLPNLIFSLEEFFNFHSVGLLVTCDFISAMWKDGENFFIFYACPIDESGKIVKLRSAYSGLVNFKSVFDLHNNILSNTRNEQGPFELRICSIVMSESEQEKCENLRRKNNKEIVMPAVSLQESKFSGQKIILPDDEKHQMIAAMMTGEKDKFIKFSRGSFMCGRISKISKSLDEFSRNFHSPAICVFFAAMCACKDPNCWTTDVIDAVIISGNSLYIESSVLAAKVEVNITKIVPLLCIGCYRVSMKIEPRMEIDQKDLMFEHLTKVFDAMFDCERACYIMRKWECWILVRCGNLFFLFDPLGISFPGKKKKLHRATMYRFDSIINAIKHLIDCINDNVMGVDSTCTLEIGSVKSKVMERSEKPKKIAKKSPVKKNCSKMEISKEKPAIFIKEIESVNRTSDCE